MTTIPSKRRAGPGTRAARLAGVTLLVAAMGVAASVPTSAGRPVADRARPGAAPAPAARPAAPESAGGTTMPAEPRSAPIDFTRSGGVNGVPASVLAAYRGAATSLAITQPGCRLPAALLAAIGRVESGHARGGLVDATGTTLTPILGPVLAGDHGFAAIRDTDAGRLDGDPLWDRAVGPMQFIPGTWTRWAADGNTDGVANPHNVYDASLAAGRYLCANNRDLAVPADLNEAVLSYNRSPAYLRLVLAWMRSYALDVTAIPDGAGSPLPVTPDRTSTGDGTGPDLALPAPPAPPVATPTAPAPDQPTPGRPGEPSTPVPPTGTPSTPAPPGPLTSVLCVVGGVLGGLGGLLGAPAPAPPEDCVPPG
ncbi:lytic transglycosylase domain-containing protein [Actinophytocola sp.]|uniref:lytic transglycosylase domain-containing protein n=1 Tax=Actinophytocola sp. TaxID=1872138 RepID=UPI002ED82F7D